MTSPVAPRPAPPSEPEARDELDALTDVVREVSSQRNVEDTLDVALRQTAATTPVLHFANLHGDIVATVPNRTPTAADPTGVTPTGFFESTEYGTPRDTTITNRYTWLGIHQRSTDTLAELTLMGARLYNPTTGIFLSTDPIRGGNANAYTYPIDPMNMVDLDGRWGIPKRLALKALDLFKKNAPWTLKGACAPTNVGIWLCSGIAGGLVGVVIDLLWTKIQDNYAYWMSKKSLAWSFIIGAGGAIGGKYWGKYRPALVKGAIYLVGAVQRLLRRIGLGVWAAIVGTYATGGITIAAGMRSK